MPFGVASLSLPFLGEPAMKRMFVPLFLGCCAFLGGFIASGLTLRLAPLAAQVPSAKLKPVEAGSDLAKLGERFELVARTVSPAVVAIEAVKPSAKGSKSKTTDDSGSGALIRLPGQKNVFVLTNNHVINRAAPKQITISLGDNRIFKPSRVWSDPESDIALLALDTTEKVPTLALGDSDTARVGQLVLAFGSPFGLNQTVTHGIISARGRGQVSLGSTIRIKDFLQTDAAINPGSSGGPLVNLQGEMIGMNTAIASPSGSNSGVAFSIPVNMVKQIAEQLLTKGKVSRGYLGVQLSPGFEAAEAYKLGLSRAQGALVEGVHTDTPAAAAGFRRNDVILEIDGVAVRNENQFINVISTLPPGQKIRLRVWREKKAIALEATVGDWAKAENRFKK
jgi:S1-C subfamily serine protease